VKRSAFFVILIAAFGPLFADGSSGDYLLSPDFSVTGTKAFTGPSDSYDRGGWYCIDPKGYARKNGVGLRANANGSLCYDFPNNQLASVQTLTVVCSTASSAAAKAENTLGVELTTSTGENLSGSFSFFTGSQGGTASTTFLLEESILVKSLRFWNEGAQVFELGSVSWTSALPKLSVNYAVEESVRLGASFSIAVNDVSGGSGVYTSLSVSFNGFIHTVSDPFFPVSFSFDAPSTSGDYPFEIVVKDDKGMESRVSGTIQVVPYASPCDLTASAITRDSFELTWQMDGGVTPSAYTLEVEEQLTTTRATLVVTPDWTAESDQIFQSKTPFDLAPWTEGARVGSAFATVHGEIPTSFEMSLDGGETWVSKPFIGEKYLLNAIPAGAQQLLFRVKAENKTPPRYLTLELQQIQRTIETREIAVTAQQLQQVVTGLTSGSSYSVKVSAHYKNADNSTAIRTSAPLIVTTQAFPAFTEVRNLADWEMLQLTWPKEERNLRGEIRIFAERSLPRTVTPGVYLSRVLWIKSGGGLSTAKAVALTNTTDRPIHLRGEYVLKTVKRDTGKTYSWDFSDKSAGALSVYPHVIPAGGELILASEKYPPFDCREGVVCANVQALNFTGDWDVALVKGNTLQNSLTPQENAVICLAEDSLLETETFRITAEMPRLDALYEPWMALVETRLLRTFSVTQQGASTNSLFDYAAMLENLESTRKVWAACRTTDGTSFSVPIEVLIWQPPMRPGFLFRLR
jgi:hypothetical protein